MFEFHTQARWSRRRFLGVGFAGIAGSALAQSNPSPQGPVLGGQTSARVIVVGGGYGGAIAARYLRRFDPRLKVTLIEQNRTYIACPLSNEVLSGERSLAANTFGYGGLEQEGIRLIHDRVTRIDPDPSQKFVTTRAGDRLRYDFLIVSPGVELLGNAIEGYDQEAMEIMPHAWKAGPQTRLLRAQLETMEDGGVAMIVAPKNPYRCPPGPYERASLIAHYFKHHKPRSKVVILDSKGAFAKQGLFQQAWDELYGDRIEWVSRFNDGVVERVDPKKGKIFTTFETHRPAVANIIPPQQAGRIAQQAGLADDSGWCPVDHRTFESTRVPDVHVIGDACQAGPMPKSGYSANSQGKVAAAAVVSRIAGLEPPRPSYANTCYSILGEGYGISVAAIYRLENGSIVSVPGAGGLSPMDASPRDRAVEAKYQKAWFKNITAEMFG